MEERQQLKEPAEPVVRRFLSVQKMLVVRGSGAPNAVRDTSPGMPGKQAGGRVHRGACTTTMETYGSDGGRRTQASGNRTHRRTAHYRDTGREG